MASDNPAQKGFGKPRANGLGGLPGFASVRDFGAGLPFGDTVDIPCSA
jgi:hypothetical protein